MRSMAIGIAFPPIENTPDGLDALCPFVPTHRLEEPQPSRRRTAAAPYSRSRLAACEASSAFVVGRGVVEFIVVVEGRLVGLGEFVAL